MAFNKGIVVVISAGNSGTTTDPHIGTPADAIGALTIGAVNSLEQYATFSSIGPSYDGRVKPDVCAKGLGTTVCSPTGTIYNSSGTSFSSPVIAGMVATFWSAVPNLTAQQVVQFIKQSSDNYSNPTIQKGYGIPDFQLALTAALNMEIIVDEDPKYFTVYPNPTENLMFLRLEDASEKGMIEIINTLGQKVAEKEFEGSYNAFIDLEDLPKGIYYYRYLSTKEHVGKIIKK